MPVRFRQGSDPLDAEREDEELEGSEPQEQARQAPPEEPDTQSDDDEEEDEEGNPVVTVRPATPTRKEKKQRRYSEMDLQLHLERQRNALLEQQVRQQQQPVFYPQQPQQQQPEPDPEDHQISALQERRSRLTNEFNALTDAERHAKAAEYRQEWQKTEDQLIELKAQKVTRRQLQQYLPRQMTREQMLAQQQDQLRRSTFMIEHGDIYPAAEGGYQEDSRPWQHAQALVRIRALRMSPEDLRNPIKTMQVIRECTDEARREFGLPTKFSGGSQTSQRRRQGSVSASERARFTGASAVSSGPDGRQRVSLDRYEQAMADAAYGHIKDPKERLKRMARNKVRRSDDE